MAETSGFFNAQLVNEEYDRAYVAEQFAAYFASFIGNGVFLGQQQDCQVTATTPVTSMGVNVQPGRAWLNGYWYNNDAPQNLTVSVGDATRTRIDAVALRHDKSGRVVNAVIIEGTPSASPVAPAPVRDVDYYDIILAHITIPAGSIIVTNAMISDTRPNSEICGWVSGLIEQVDTTDLYLQFQSFLNDFIVNQTADFETWSSQQQQAFETWAEGEQSDFEAWESAQQSAVSSWISTNTAAWQADFDEWFASVQDILDEDVAGNLTQAVNELDARTSNLEKMVIKGSAFAPLSDESDALITTSDNYTILLNWKL